MGCGGRRRRRTQELLSFPLCSWVGLPLLACKAISIVQMLGGGICTVHANEILVFARQTLADPKQSWPNIDPKSMSWHAVWGGMRLNCWTYRVGKIAKDFTFEVDRSFCHIISGFLFHARSSKRMRAAAASSTKIGGINFVQGDEKTSNSASMQQCFFSLYGPKIIFETILLLAWHWPPPHTFFFSYFFFQCSFFNGRPMCVRLLCVHRSCKECGK